MGCSAPLLLLLLLRLLLALGAVWGIHHGETETVPGTLGKATILRIPPRLRELTREFRESSWKRWGPFPRKQVLVKYSGGNCTNHFQGQIRFHGSDFSLEILNTSRGDGQLYEYVVSKGPEEEVLQLQLKVYEPISHPSIRILSRELSNGSCTFALNCTTQEGDEVSYSWGSQDSGISGNSGPCSGNSSFLSLSHPPWDTNIPCVCTATNPVSSGAVAFQPPQCGHEPRAEQEQEPSPEHTIYSQVQRVQKPKEPPSPDPNSCTTIYAAATGPPGRAPRAPPEPPTLQGPPPLSQSPPRDPTTVYVGVMMPRP
ncbi:signaling lymphocytic activation molecule-like [Neopelma chrysocephalum]|uniref:signaling lymphocytic activation molecule-like n=1 Tax=Neopelma chrysocephalum TaxID=114329 RepID=UPI000FCD1355|nr:signaling lymphocytic activation molecule-like [Neopelma chrysocephalum]